MLIGDVMQHTIYINEEIEDFVTMFQTANKVSFNKAVSVLIRRGIMNPSRSEYAECLEAIKTYRAKLDAFNENRQEMDKI